MIPISNELINIDKQLDKQRLHANYYSKYGNFDNWIKYILRVAKLRAKRKNIEFNITSRDLPFVKICPILGIELEVNANNRDNCYSIDRINNSKGYIKGNVHLISHRANRIKNDSTVDELIKISDYLKGLDKS